MEMMINRMIAAGKHICEMYESAVIRDEKCELLVHGKHV